MCDKVKSFHNSTLLKQSFVDGVGEGLNKFNIVLRALLDGVVSVECLCLAC